MVNYTNTEDMVYDLRKHRYILTVDGFSRKYGMSLTDLLMDQSDLDPDTIAERFLDRASMYVYEYIKEWSEDSEKKIYEVSKAKYRDAIEEAMGELVYGWIINNTDVNLFFNTPHQEMIKLIPIVHTILMNGECLHRGLYRYFGTEADWRDKKGIDW